MMKSLSGKLMQFLEARMFSPSAQQTLYALDSAPLALITQRSTGVTVLHKEQLATLPIGKLRALMDNTQKSGSTILLLAMCWTVAIPPLSASISTRIKMSPMPRINVGSSNPFNSRLAPESSQFIMLSKKKKEGNVLRIYDILHYCIPNPIIPTSVTPDQ